MSPQAAPLLARLRGICLALPETAEKLSHGMPAFQIEKGKMFAYFWHRHHGDDITAAIVKTGGPDEQAMLIESDPETYYRPPYFGPAGWVGFRLDADDVDWDRLTDRVTSSWELIAPRRLLPRG